MAGDVGRPPEKVIYDVLDESGVWRGMLSLQRLGALQGDDARFIFELKDGTIVVSDAMGDQLGLWKDLLEETKRALATDDASEQFGSRLRIKLFNKANHELAEVEAPRLGGGEANVIRRTLTRDGDFCGYHTLYELSEYLMRAKGQLIETEIHPNRDLIIDNVATRMRSFLMRVSKEMISSALSSGSITRQQYCPMLKRIRKEESALELPQPTRGKRVGLNKTTKYKWMRLFDDKGRYCGVHNLATAQSVMSQHRTYTFSTDGVSLFVRHTSSHDFVAKRLLSCAKTNLRKIELVGLFEDDRAIVERALRNAKRDERYKQEAKARWRRLDPAERARRTALSDRPTILVQQPQPKKAAPPAISASKPKEKAPASTDVKTEAPPPQRQPARSRPDAEIVADMSADPLIRRHIEDALRSVRGGDAGRLRSAIDWARKGSYDLPLDATDWPRLLQTMREGTIEPVVTGVICLLKAYFEQVQDEQNAAGTPRTQVRHFMSAWCEDVLSSAASNSQERLFARAFMSSPTHGNVLIPDEDILDDAMATGGITADMLQDMAEVLPAPYDAFVIRVDGIEGLYGIGVCTSPTSPAPTIVPIHNDSRAALWDDDTLMRVYRRIVYVIMFLINDHAGTLYVDEERQRMTPADHHSSFEPDILRISTLYVGPKICFIKSGPRPATTIDRAPCAVRGSWCRNRHGTTWWRRPHWRRGTGAKRGQVPQEVLEHNLRFRRSDGDS